MHTLGFSRFSKYYDEKSSGYYDPALPVSQSNMPTVLDEHSIAYKFAKMLETMDQEGRIEQIYNHYRLEVE